VSGRGAEGPRERRLAWARDAGAALVAAQQAAGGLDGARAAMRSQLRRWPAHPDVLQECTTVRGLLVHRFRPPVRANGGAVLYVHGGGFTAGSGADYGALLGPLAVDLAADVLACDYRLAPEHPFPSALDDVESVLDALLDQVFPVAVAADSAGGALAVSAVLRRQRQRRSLPCALVLFSPLLDLTATAASYDANATRDGMLSRSAVRRIAGAYLGGHDAADDRASPLLTASLEGFPPTALYVGSDEVLRDDTVAFGGRLARAGVEVRTIVLAGLPHVWQVFGQALPEARQTIGEAAGFLRTWWSPDCLAPMDAVDRAVGER
jgi:monoterpene epsilon-lactone hydrolase